MMRNYKTDVLSILTGFNELVAIAKKKYGEPHKLTQTETVISYCWKVDEIIWQTMDGAYPVKSSEIMPVIKEYITLNGWKLSRDDVDSKFVHLSRHKQIFDRYYNLTYDIKSQKISFKCFDAGYGWSHRKERLYPYSKSKPLLCLSNKIYVFTQIKVSPRRFAYKVRLYSGRYYNSVISDYLRHVLNCTEEVLKLYVPYQYMLDSQSSTNTLHRYLGDGLTTRELGIPATSYNILLDAVDPTSVKKNQKELRILVDIMNFRRRLDKNSRWADIMGSSVAFMRSKRFNPINYKPIFNMYYE